jgi:hypothetical protein
LRGTQEDGHDGQQASPLANLHYNARRHRDATGAQLDHRRAERLHQAAQVQQAFNLVSV